MANPWIAALLALFVWWFSTGAILMVVKRSDRMGGNAHLVATLLGLPVLVLGWIGLSISLGSPTVPGAYLGFLSAIAIWGWIELAFLCGIITGPNKTECPDRLQGWERFIRAWGTIAHSEAALVASLIVIGLLSWDAPNAVALWTFAVLFFARISAKLNVFLGVPNINIEFLPDPMKHLASHFKVSKMNWFFPVGVTLLSLAFFCWLHLAMTAPAGGGERIGFALLAALTGLAIVEHWVMVLPIPDAKLWRFLVKFSESGPSGPKTRPILREDA